MADSSRAIRKTLVDLAKRSSARTLMQEVTEARPEIEQAIKAGASYAAICDAFAQHGVEITPVVLRTYLYRLRKAATPNASTPPKPSRKTSAGSAP